MSAAAETHCRLCAELSAADQSISINKESEKCSELQSTLEFLNVDVSSSNTLPKAVCHGCFDMLTRIRSFYNQVRGAQERLNAIYSGKTYVENVIVKIEPTEEVWVSIEPEPVSDDNSSSHQTKMEANNIEITNTEPIDIKRALSAHMSIDIDDEDRPYKCTICDTAFRAKRTLKIHLLTHSKLKPFQCDICMKSFQFKMYLQRHIAVHTDKMPFPCNVCKKQFRTNRCLQIHLRQHTGDKPYKCEVCGHDFNNWSNRYRHMKRKHNVGPKKSDKIKVDNINIK